MSARAAKWRRESEMGEMAHNNEIHGTHRVQVRSYTDDNVVRSIDP
jgi:hypothetical protein